MRKKKIFIAIGALLVVGFFLFIRSGNKLPSPEVIAVKRGAIAEKVIAVGSIVPRHTISVKSNIPGIVGILLHDEGDYIEQGSLLLQVSPAPTPESVAEAYAAVKEHLAIVKQAKEHQKRLAKLVKLKMETPDNYAITLKDLSTSNARLEMAQQKLALIQKGEATIAGQNIKTTIHSPISGYILQRNVDVGDPVVPLTEAQEGTILFVIANMQDLIFRGSVNEIDVAKINPNMTANISIAALPDVKIQGTLSKVGLRSNQERESSLAASSGGHSPFNVGFNVELNNLQLPKDWKLRAGYSATAEITVKKVENAIILPERALIFKDNKVWVHLIDKNRKKIQEKEIKLGISDGINVEVVAGLNENQNVLIDTAVT